MNRYNLNPLDDLFNDRVPSFEDWRKNIHEYFNNPKYDTQLLDEYYDALICDIHTLPELLSYGYLIDDYSGLFTLNNPQMIGKHTFNLANFIRRNHPKFGPKTLFTVCADYGIVNVQIKLCGLALCHATIPAKNRSGQALVNIGNHCPPYKNRDYRQFDVVFASNVFQDNPSDIWNTLVHYRRIGKEVYFTTDTFSRLTNVIDYDRLEAAENPAEIYDKDTYADLSRGYMYRIYRLK
jgi:hypothetical protein